MTPTQLSIKKLKEDGFFCQVVERWNPFAHIRQDLFGAIDILGTGPGQAGCIGVQATTTGNINARFNKALALPAIRAFVTAGNKFVVWGWAKRGPRGKRKVWELKEVLLTNDHCRTAEMSSSTDA